MTAEPKEPRWREYMPEPEYRFSWCPLMKQRCMGAICALWIARLKRCSLAVMALSLLSIQSQQK